MEDSTGGAAGRGGLKHNEVSYCTDGLGGDYLGGDSHGKHRPLGLAVLDCGIAQYLKARKARS